MKSPLELPERGSFRLVNVTVPAGLENSCAPSSSHELCVEAGRIARSSTGPAIDADGSMILPALIDMHTHLDKGHIWPRSPNPDGTFAGALTTVAADRAVRWNRDDLRRRMEFTLRCAYAHGTRVIRTHLDSVPPQHQITWPLFCDMRAEWAGRIELQAVTILGIEFVNDSDDFRMIADTAAAANGILGCVTYPVPDLARRLEVFFRTAAERGMDADLHVDETLDASTNTLRLIARTALRTRFPGKITAGHCCSLSCIGESELRETLDLVEESGIAIVSLPMCNMYLQDRHPNRTPRLRGVTLVHELAERGIPVAFASDNNRDPFFAYGDCDMIEVMREATRICHLDHSRHEWIHAFLQTPAEICRFPYSAFEPGSPADLLILRARTWNELLARPQSDRVVVRNGIPLMAELPDYRELDDIMVDS